MINKKKGKDKNQNKKNKKTNKKDNKKDNKKENNNNNNNKINKEISLIENNETIINNNKINKEISLNENTETEKNKESNNNKKIEEELDIRKHWKLYYDPHYKQNFYYNPFTNQSLWELPPDNICLDTIPIPLPSNTTTNTNTTTNLNPTNQQTPIEESQEDIDEIKYQKFKESNLKEWMKRPARQQVQDTRKDINYIEGNFDYNIWYNKFLTDRHEKEKIPALYKCNPALDTGYTKADISKEETFFCLFFAKGCCCEGYKCNYYHRVPLLSDCEKVENLRDIFGRSRFNTKLKDNGGIGVFTQNCRTLLVSDLKRLENVKNNIKSMVRIIYQNFSQFGDIEDINYVDFKNICYIKFKHRCFAEFAKEAMMRQHLVGEEIINVTWAYDLDEDPENKENKEKEEDKIFLDAVKKKYKENQGNLSEIEKLNFILKGIDEYNNNNNNNKEKNDENNNIN